MKIRWPERFIEWTGKTLLVLTAALPTHSFAEDAERPELFGPQDTLKLKITAPWNTLQRDRKFQGAYPATIEFNGPDGQAARHELTVERRGVKRQEACIFPPIRLRFEKDEVKGTLFHGQKSLKMVTHCKKSARYEQYYVLEMLAYRIYNLLTEASFRVRPLSVTYVDADSGKADEDRFAFLIEDDSDVAKRNGLKKLEIEYVLPSRQQAQTASDLAVFQHLIGNVDWSSLKGPEPECCHNVKLIAPRPLQESDQVLPVPYDFDSSGIVNAPYAAPAESLRLNNIRQRLYRGFCAHNEALENTRQRLLAKERAIMALLENEQRLTTRNRKEARDYVEEYFEIVKDDRDWQRDVVRKCRK